MLLPQTLLLLFSHSVVPSSLRPHGLQHTRLPCLHHLPELAQTHVHWGAIQSSHPLSFPSPPAFYLARRQDLFQRVSASIQVAKVLEFQLQHQSFQCIQVAFLSDWLCLQFKGLWRAFSNNLKASVLQPSAFLMVQLTFIHDYWKSHSFDYTDLCQQCLCFLICCTGLS